MTQTVSLKAGAAGAPILNERLSAASGILPSHLVAESSGTIAVHAVDGGNAQKLFTQSNLTTSGDIDTAYVSGEIVSYGAYHSGQEVRALLAASALAIVDGNPLVSAGDGTLRKAISADVKATLTVAGQSDADGAIVYTSLLDGDHGNDIQIIQLDAGTAAVVVDGLVITITPASAGNTATEVVAQIVADPGASSLISATVSPGDGSTEPGIATIANMSGGLDGELDSDQALIAYATEAVDNSSGGTVVPINVRVA